MVTIPDTLKWKATGRVLGSGGQGQVLEVVDPIGNDPSMRFAMKVLAPTRPRQAYARFVTELTAIKELHGRPNIVEVVDCSGPDDSFHFYVMPVYEGAVSLKTLIDRQENPFHANPELSVGMFRHIMLALSDCEQRRIVHRDISPGNVLIRPDRSILLIDFGICQIADGETVTLIDEGVGTRNYTAPECEAHSRSHRDSRADFYSAGKVLWTAITSHTAFARERPVFTEQSMQRLFPQNELAWHVGHLFEKTIRRQPEDRFRNTQEAVTAAERVSTLIWRRQPPLELLGQWCHRCGWGDTFEKPRYALISGDGRNIRQSECTYCGYGFVVNLKRAQDTVDGRAALE